MTVNNLELEVELELLSNCMFKNYFSDGAQIRNSVGNCLDLPILLPS